MKDGEGRFQGGWKQLYEAAILELDPKLLPQRIADAQKAIGERAMALLQDQGHNHSEKEPLASAHVALNDLERIQQKADPTLKHGNGSGT